MRTARRSAVAVPALTVLALAGAAVLAGCGSTDASTGAQKTDTTTKTGLAQVAVTMTGNRCAIDHDSVGAGPVKFTVTNRSATGITEFELLDDQKIIGEKENLAPGLAPVSLTLTLGGGRYQVYCPGADKELLDLTVTGKASASPTGSAAQLLAEGTKTYAAYVTTEVEGMVAAVENLQQAIAAGDLAQAQKLYGVARPFYEKIESDVEGFVLPGFRPTDNQGNLDYLVDMRASNLDPAVGWHGFHAVERELFQSQKITADTKRLAAELTKNVQQLAELSKTLTYKPEDLANGAAGLLEEVQTNKISGEEEKYSHTDLVDFASNVEGAQQAFLNLKPGLAEIDADLTRTIAQRFDAVNAMLDTYRDPAAVGGYRPYTAEVRAADANTLSQTVQSLQDALAHLAEKVATA